MKYHFFRQKKYLVPVMLLLLVLLAGSFLVFRSDSLLFRLYSSKLFHTELSGNTLTLHYLIADPSTYGLNEDPVLPVYTGAEEDREKETASLKNALSVLSRISTDHLSSEDAYTCLLTERYLQSQLKATAFPYYPEPFSPGSGIQNSFPSLLADYAFRSRKDVEDYLSLLEQSGDYLDGLLLYEKEKAEAGLFMSHAAADKVIKQCSTILPEDALDGSHFLQKTFEEKVSLLVKDGSISEEDGKVFCARNDSLLQSVLAPTYVRMADTFTSFRKYGHTPAGLSSLPDGKAYYEYLLSATTGSNRPISETKLLLYEDYENNYNALISLLTRYPEIGDSELTASLDLSLSSASGALKQLHERIQKDFPVPCASDPLSPVSVVLKTVPSSMEEYTSPAYYLISPIDDWSTQTICLNRSNFHDNLSLYTTLAHEGYPGHLYQTIYSRQYLGKMETPALRYLLHYGGYTEGWAYYAENLSYDYAREMAVHNPHAAAYYEACRLNRNLHLGLYSLLDIAIHYDGASKEQVAGILKTIGITDPSSVDSVYAYLTEEPCSYPKYYVGYLEILKLKEEAMVLWEKDFSLYRFHQFLLEKGPADFQSLREMLPLYAAS